MWKLGLSNKNQKVTSVCYSYPLPRKTKNLLGVLHYHGSVQTNNKTNKKSIQKQTKAKHSGDCTIFREAILHVWIFLEVHYLRNLRGRKNRKRGKFNFTILQNKSLDKYLLIKTLSKFFLSFRYQFKNSCKIIQKLRFFWQGTSDVEVFCYKTNSYWKIIPPPVPWKTTSVLGMELELEKIIQKHDFEGRFDEHFLMEYIRQANVKQFH